MTTLRTLRCLLAAVAVVLALAVAPSESSAAEISGFLTYPMPSENWNTGYGGALSTGIAGIITFEGELAYLPVETQTGSLTSFTASALVSPPVGQFVPYGGLGFGFFRQTLADQSDTGRIHALIIGLKWKFGSMGSVRVDFREFDLSGEPLVQLQRRLSVGVGISF
jgi:hypothetical protein